VVSPAEVDTVLPLSDFVVLAAPHTPRTVHWWNQDRLLAMKKGSYLINVGRGAIVVTEDLREALVQKHLGGAALDVVDPEPLPSDDPLWRMPNVIITPHVAACSPRVAERHLKVLQDNLKRFQEGRPLLNQVDKSNWC
jgi:phosphoglycerate dehydrogenase-like enzyme